MEEPGEKVLRKRPDKIKDTIDENEYTVIKTTWNSLCKDTTKKVFPIEEIVKNVNLIAFEAYKLVNLHVLRLLENDLELPDFNQSFFYSCLAGVGMTYNRKNQEVKDIELLKTIKLYNDLKPKDYKCGFKDNMGAYLNNVSRQMKTCFQNSFDANFYKRLVKYVKRKQILWNKQQVYLFLRDVYDQKYKGLDAEVWKMKAKMNFEYPTLKSTLKLQRNILLFLEKCNQRLFGILPNRSSFTINYVQMCSSCLRDTLVSKKLTTLDNKKFLEKKDEFWRGLFNIEQFETKNRKFHYEILTDGKGVSVVLRKPKSTPVEKEDTINLEDYDSVWAGDPGLKDMLTATNENHEVLKFSSKEYYHDTKMYFSNRKIKKWYSEDDRVKELFANMPTMKTSKVRDVAEYLQVMFNNIHYLFNFHWKKKFRDLKFTRMVMAQKKLHKICTKIAGEGKTLFGFGDWSNNDKCIKGHNKGPVQKVKKALKKYCKVVDVDEHLSSKPCHNCKCHLEKMVYNVYDEDHKKMQPSKRIHSVLCCKNTQCPRKVMNRDVNASRNILEIMLSVLTTGRRPECFQRN